MYIFNNWIARSGSSSPIFTCLSGVCLVSGVTFFTQPLQIGERRALAYSVLFLLLLAWFLAIYSYTWLYLSYKTLGTSLAIKTNYLGQKYWIGNVSWDMWKTSISLFNNQCKIFFQWCSLKHDFVCLVLFCKADTNFFDQNYLRWTPFLFLIWTVVF